MKELWLHYITRVNVKTRETAVLSEKHFTLDDRQINVRGNKVLKKTVYDFPAHLTKDPKLQRVLKIKHEDIISSRTGNLFFY